MAFEFANDHIPERKILKYYLTDSDIYFNNTLTNVYSLHLSNTVLCLTRHEITNHGLQIQVKDHWSQDVWVLDRCQINIQS